GPHVPPLEVADPVETQRDGEREDDRRRHGEQEQLDGVADGGPEGRIGEHLLVESQAHELARPTRRDLVERVRDGLRERQQEYGTEEQQSRQYEQKPRTLAAIEVVLRENEAIPLSHGAKGLPDELVSKPARARSEHTPREARHSRAGLPGIRTANP